MALVNQAKREINAKIVFFGPGLAGKATNLRHVYQKLKPEFRGALKAMNVQDARMLFFDFTPPGDGNVDGFRVRFHVYTVSGHSVDPAAWKMVLKGADGLVFVADSASGQQAANRDSLDNLALYLKGYGQSLGAMPLVFQYNKSDLSDAVAPAEMERVLNPSRLPSFQASSQSGEGVLQTLLSLVKTVLTGMRNKGVEAIASGESLQRMVETPAAPPVPPAPVAASAPPVQAPAAEFELPQTEVRHSAAEPQAPPVRGFLDQEAEPAYEQPLQPQEPLLLELSGAPQPQGDGTMRVPLTVRSGGRSKSFVLTLALSLAEEL